MRTTQKISLVALAGALLGIYFEIVAAGNVRFLSYHAGLLMTLWTVMPYITLWAGKYFFQRCDILKPWLQFAVFEVLVVAWVYWQTLFMYPDAQDSLIFLFLPLIQVTVNLVVGILFYVLQVRRLNKEVRDGVGCG